MDAAVIIVIVVVALIVLAAIVLAGRKRAQQQKQERLARVQTDARRDDATYERQSAGERLREAQEAEEEARRAREDAERHEARAAEVDPDHNGHHTDREVGTEGDRGTERERERPSS